jgi:Fic family protein
MSLHEMLQRLDAKKSRLDAARPLPSASVKSLVQDFRLRYTHETTAIEGNTLTLRETQAVLENGITVHGKPLRDHLEVINVNDALDWLAKAVERKEPPSEKLIMQFHRILMKGILDEDAGYYRTVPVLIQGAKHIPPNWRKVPTLMQELEVWLRETSGHPVVIAASAHIRLARIHPFVDGNGRTCRLLVNYILLQHGYPSALYTTERRDEYMRALDAVEQGDDEPFTVITAEAIEWTLDRYLLIVEDLG